MHAAFSQISLLTYKCNKRRFFLGVFGFLFAACSSVAEEKVILAARHKALYDEAYDFCTTRNFDTKHFFLSISPFILVKIGF